ncbi:glycosyltransferase N-terminal domain-containing protein [Maribacter confluentis]|uniref:3-deoxy-D-manno-octulosonic acid transferase n=1 Tax=Maribacter confluentis TaxID=1656093 RepID=A0ABT8RVD7_9FLAO|nr:glycosyltransferase N-terminal domain-containing protein [Maribacter confluentis]MDO1513418.1 glycosyltransferase N-terminal domain-containing protein [Maribacter confluentis]MDO1514868.1 glycosyltransferase N-terminal domain-containing protein [Maribacter confluentis]
MSFLYNLIGIIATGLLALAAPFSAKLALFVNGRKKSITLLRNNIAKNDRTIWIHAASLGEFEQGLPIIEQLKKDFPLHKLVLSFFSPSGYEVKKNSNVADVICYLPIDTKHNASEFIKAVNPELAIFIKYEIWPNYLRMLNKQNIPTILVSALFKKEQIYFKKYGSFMRKALANFTHFFVQNTDSKTLLYSIGHNNVSITGDTRFDRVMKILKRNNNLTFMDTFTKGKFCFVGGSTWPEDEELVTAYINQSKLPIKFIIAPHTVKASHIDSIKRAILKPTICYSELKDAQIQDYDVLIIDTIGLLTKIYSYADIAYVGGGFATGLHNTLEPAVFGIPVLIGPHYKGFIEAENLVAAKGVLPVHTFKDFKFNVDRFFEDIDLRKNTGSINKKFIHQESGATDKIMATIHPLLLNNVFKTEG